MEPKTFRYTSTLPEDEPIRRRLRQLASQRRRFGYRRLGLLLGRKGIVLSHKKLYRLYREERLMVRKRGGRKPYERGQIGGQVTPIGVICRR